MSIQVGLLEGIGIASDAREWSVARSLKSRRNGDGLTKWAAGGVPMEESIGQTEGTVAYEPIDAAPTPEEWYAEREL